MSARTSVLSLMMILFSRMPVIVLSFLFAFWFQPSAFPPLMSASVKKCQCIWKNVKAVVKLIQCQKQILPFNRSLRLSQSLTASNFKHTQIPILLHNLLFRSLFSLYSPFYRNFDVYAVLHAFWSKTSRISFRWSFVTDQWQQQFIIKKDSKFP